MPNKELYTALYTKYAPELSPEELEEKLDYALKQDSNDFIGQFYQKYTGQGPTEEQSQEINRVIDDPSPQTTTRETSWWRGEEGLIPDEFQGIQRPDVEVETPTTQDVSGRFYGFGGKVPTKETEEKRKTSEGYLADEKDFKQHLDKFFDDGSLFNQIYSDEEINKGKTLREIESEAIEAGRDPSEYLLDLVKKEVGVGGLFTSRNEVDPGRKNYLNPSSMSKEENNLLFSNLDDNDIEKIIDEVFYSRLETENTNRENATAVKELQTAVDEGVDARDVHKGIRQRHIKEYRNVNLSIAQLVEKINHGDGSEEEKFGKLNEKTGEYEGGYWQQLQELKDKSKTTMLVDLATGQLTVARDSEHAGKLKGENSNLADLDSSQEKTEILDFLGRLAPETQLDYIQNEFERHSLVRAGEEKYLDQLVEVTYSPPGSSDEYYDGPMTVTKSVPLREVIKHEKESTWIGQYATEKYYLHADNLDKLVTPEGKTLKDVEDIENLINLQANTRLKSIKKLDALKSIYLLNEGLMDVKKGEYAWSGVVPIPTNFEGLKQSATAVVKPWTSEYFTNSLIGSTGRDKLEAMEQVYNQLGVELTKDEQEKVEKTLAEGVNTTVLEMNKMLVEFYGINKGLAVAGVASRFNALMNTLKGGTYVRNGTRYTEAVIKSRAAAQFPKLKEAEALSAYLNINKGLRLVPSRKNTFLSIAGYGGYEGIKFGGFSQIDVTRPFDPIKPTAGLRSFGEHFASGFGFGAAGRMISPLTPWLQREKGLLKDVDTKILGKDIGLNSRALFETFVTKPASFVAGSEAAELTMGITNDFFGNKQLKNFMDHHYHSYGDVGQRLISNYFVGIGLGIPHFKGFESYKSKEALGRVQEKAGENMIKVVDQASESVETKQGVDYQIRDGKLINLKTGSKSAMPPELKNKMKVNFFDKEVQNWIHENLSDKNIAELYKHWEVYDGMSMQIMRANMVEGYLDPTRAQELIERDHKEFIEREKAEGREVKIELVDHSNLRPFQKPMENRNKAEILDAPDGKGKIIRYDARHYTPDVMPHEVNHYFTEAILGKDVVFKADFMRNLYNIGNKIKLERLVTESEAKELGNLGRQGQRMTLSESIKLEYPIDNSIKSTRIQQWEMFAHIAEQIGKKNNYNAIKETNGFEQLKELLNVVAKRTGKKINLTQEKDVVRWFADYSRNVKKGSSVVEMFEELKTVIDPQATKMAAAERAKFGQKPDGSFASRNIDLPGGEGRVNNPKEIASETQRFFTDNKLEGKGLDSYRELMGQKLRPDGKYDIDMKSPHADFEYYPVLGNKFGAMFDIAVAKYNSRVPERYRVNMADRSLFGERAELATATMTDKRGFESILKTYDPKRETQLMSHVVGDLSLRMQEIKERSIDKKYETRAAEKEGVVISGTEVSEIKTNLQEIKLGGGIDRSAGNTELTAETKGIKLRDHEFSYGGGVKRKINPKSIEKIEKAGEDVFFNTPLKELTYVGVSRRMRDITMPEMDVLFRGGKEGLKTPKSIREVEDIFINNNPEILYEGMHEFSNPKFYENTNWGKTIFSKFYKNTGKKFSNAELPVDLTKETNARTTKWEKLDAKRICRNSKRR